MIFTGNHALDKMQPQTQKIQIETNILLVTIFWLEAS